MFINKIGADHVEAGLNCQDYGRVVSPNLSVICDGCSEGKHSEVGAKLYCHLLTEEADLINNTPMDAIVKMLGNSSETVRDFMCFTVLYRLEEQDRFSVLNCGDGFVILEDHNGHITLEELTDGEYPKYLAYNYLDRSKLRQYQDGVEFDIRVYDKKKYKKVGIASDGLRFILSASDELKTEFINCLKSGKEVKTKLFINRNKALFKDDITIIF